MGEREIGGDGGTEGGLVLTDRGRGTRDGTCPAAARTVIIEEDDDGLARGASRQSVKVVNGAGMHGLQGDGGEGLGLVLGPGGA